MAENKETPTPEIKRDAAEVMKVLVIYHFLLNEDSPLLPEEQEKRRDFIEGLQTALAWVLGYSNSSNFIEESIIDLEKILKDYNLIYNPAKYRVELTLPNIFLVVPVSSPGDPTLN